MAAQGRGTVAITIAIAIVVIVAIVIIVTEAPSTDHCNDPNQEKQQKQENDCKKQGKTMNKSGDLGKT